jgi:uncharacterized protein DUF5666
MLMTRRHLVLLAGWISLATAGTGCSGSTTSPSTSGSAAASITGTITQAFASSGGLSVGLMGTSVSSSVDGAGRFALGGVPAGDHDLHITGSGVDAHVRIAGVSAHEHVDVKLRVDGSTVSVEEIERENEDDNEIEVEGLVTAIDLNARTLTVRGKVVSVPTGVSIAHNKVTIDFGQIKIGDRVEVHATMTGSTITATRVKVEDAEPAEVDD